MKYDVIKGDELTPELTERWAQIQASRDDLASPYFRPEFTEHVAAVRDDAFVGVLEDGGRVVGFFPFHRRRGGVGRPIGFGLSDYHGVIAEPDAEWTVADLLRGCGLVRYVFDHLPVSQSRFSGWQRTVDSSPIIDLSDGFDAFEASRDKAGRKQLREIERKRSRFETEHGPLTYIAHATSEEVLQTLMQWKSAQCRQTGTIDYFALAWCRRLIERIHRHAGDGFGGVLACLYAGDELAAAHFAMRSRTVLHSWFPVYSDAYRANSPGMILLIEMIRSAAADGVATIDLGKGMSTYKKRFMTGSIEVAEGCAEVPSLLNSARHCRETVEQWSRSSVLRPVLRWPGRVIRHMERRARYG